MIQTAIFMTLLIAASPTIEIQGCRAGIEIPVRYQGELPAQLTGSSRSWVLSGEIGGEKVAVPLQLSAQFDHTAFFILPKTSTADLANPLLNRPIFLDILKFTRGILRPQ